MNVKKHFFILYAFFGVLSSFAQGINKDESDTTVYLNEVIVNAYQINTRQHQVPGAISVLIASSMNKMHDPDKEDK
ncbi:MAG: hypothetical protein GX670_02580 [Bacteroidales bacterium]|nr:hypothetical protein [Bacteroidales bacterium]